MPVVWGVAEGPDGGRDQGGVSQMERETVCGGVLSALYKALVLIMKSPWQMGLISEVSHRFAAGCHTPGSTYTLSLFLVKCAPSLSLLVLFTPDPSLSLRPPPFIPLPTLVFYS